MLAADVVVDEIVRGGDLDYAGAVRRIDAAVGDDANGALDERHHGECADEAAVALVIRMHGERGVAEHGFGPGGRGNEAVRADLALHAVGQRNLMRRPMRLEQGICDVPQAAVLLFVLNLDV